MTLKWKIIHIRIVIWSNTIELYISLNKSSKCFRKETSTFITMGTLEEPLILSPKSIAIDLS